MRRYRRDPVLVGNIDRLIGAGWPYRKAAEHLGISVGLIQRVLKEHTFQEKHEIRYRTNGHSITLITDSPAAMRQAVSVVELAMKRAKIGFTDATQQ